MPGPMPIALPPQLQVRPIPAFDAVVRVPGSKSLTHRALLLAALADGSSVITDPLAAEDTDLTAAALSSLGFRLDRSDDNRTITVHGRAGAIPATSASLNLGLAGTACRLLTGFVAAGRGSYTLDGVPRMRQRPMGELIEPLRQLGVSVTCLQEEGFPPLRIDADGIRGGDILMRPTLSSQFISALLMVGPLMDQGLTLRFEGPITSQPYVGLTLGMMRRFGATVEVAPDWTAIRVIPGRYRATDCTVEPDASSASYFLAAAAAIPGSRITVPGLGTDSLQGDAAFADVLGQMGAKVSRRPDSVTVEAGRRLRGVDVDLNHMPDAAMTPAALAILAESPTTIRNVGNWRVKECDRMAAMHDQLNRLGATATIDGDDLTIVPPPDGRIRPTTVQTYDDHRVAMSFAVVGLARPGVTIDDPACVAKSFPTFWQTLNKLGPAVDLTTATPGSAA